jgi:hypothetical protein
MQTVEQLMNEYLDLLATFAQDETLRAMALAACSSRMLEQQRRGEHCRSPQRPTMENPNA